MQLELQKILPSLDMYTLLCAPLHFASSVYTNELDPGVEPDPVDVPEEPPIGT